MTRETTNRLLELVEDGALSARHVLLCALLYMSEDDVRGMADANALLEDGTEEDEDAA